MRPWLIQLGPLILPTEARDELNMIATGLTREEFSDKMWERRSVEYGPVKKSHRRKWPMKAAEIPTATITHMPRKAGGRT